MNLDKADIVEKIDLRATDTPIQNKVVAADINELKRASDEIIDFIESLPVSNPVYGGLYICEGDATPQSIESGQKITIDQWTNAQPNNNLQVNDGDQSLEIPEPGIYEIRLHLSYETTARNGEVFRIRTVENGDIVPGICNRVQHQHPATTVYNTSIGRIVKYESTKTLSVEFEASAVSTTRTVVIRHGSLTVRKIDDV